MLDPNSVITEEILLGTGDRNDGIEIATGWRNSIITQNPLKEWKLYLEQASRWCDNNHTQYFKDLLGNSKYLGTFTSTNKQTKPRNYE